MDCHHLIYFCNTLQHPLDGSSSRSLLSQYWHTQLGRAAKSKSTLELLSPPGEQPSWSHTESNNHSVARARLITNTYTLQLHRSTFYNEEPTCKLCALESETTIHLLTTCPVLSLKRKSLLHPIISNIRATNAREPVTQVEWSKALLGVYNHPYNAKISRILAIACFKLVHSRHLLSCVQQNSS